jgi:alanyl-tRNA synthetase
VISSAELRKKFLEFFEKRGHAIVSSSSLISDDPSVLLTTAGMQQFKPYFTGEADPIKDFGSKNTASVQKSFRTSDIDLVGDETHLTFFEMLGNFSFGGYFKKEAIGWAYEFIVKELGLKIDYVTIFGGGRLSDQNIPYDEESEKIWRRLGVADIHAAGLEDNFWGPTGSQGPCGPTTEIYAGGSEIWNIVFNEYYCEKDRKLKPLKIPGVDTGMGLERLLAVCQKKNNVFETDLFSHLLEKVSKIRDLSSRRIIADHLRGIVFLLADGARPSNKESGYVLRRLIRRVATLAERNGCEHFLLTELIVEIIKNFSGFYPELGVNQDEIISEFKDELGKFLKTLKQGLKAFESALAGKEGFSGKKAFDIYQSYGLPREVMRDLLKEKSFLFDEAGFESEFEKHQKKSKKGEIKKFGGHGLILDTGELKAASPEEINKVTRLHTATHLLQSALRKILGLEVRQAGSDITAERARFDFTFNRKVLAEELNKIENLVNKMIKKDMPVIMKEMDYNQALKSGTLSFFKQKYPKKVKVYSIGKPGDIFSSELCAGPHVKRTGEIGKFKIIKEEAVSSGVRRIRAAVYP